MNRLGAPIEQNDLTRLVENGITYDGRLVPWGATYHGLQMIPTVSWMEEREAAKAAGYTWPAWQAVDWPERAASVAWYRLHRLVELHAEEAAAIRSELDARH